jgi:sigma-B regulation protein RsbU (phosphoserine phosphatase)
MGTAAYMSPEQARGETVDFRTDIWSLGAVLYEMLSGERPFPGELAPAVVYAVLNQEPKPISALVSGLPMQLSLVIDKALSKQVEARYQRMHDLEMDLQALLDRKAARSMAEMEVLPPRPAPASQPAFTSPDDDAPIQILVVDDEPELELLIRQKFRRQIRANEWTFVFAGNGREALDVLRDNPTLSLVLTDINMPHMDGLTLLSHIGELKRPIKTVVVSAYGDLSNIRVAMNRGAFDFVTKPIDFQDLEVTVQKTHKELQAYYKATEAQRQLVSLQKEFEVARRIQEAILPLSFPKRDDVDLYAFMTTAREVGGTFYDYFDVGANRIGFLIGDVVGKGVPAALFMAMSQTFLKGIALEGQDPGACLTTMNHLLFPEGFPDLYVTVFYGLLDTRSGELAFCNAGHPPPYVLRSGEQVAPLEGGDTAPIWQSRDHRFTTRTTTLQPGEGLLLYTQGVTGAVDEHGHPYSAERLATLLRQNHDDAPAELIRSVVRGVMQHAEDLQNDLTVLALRYLGSRE